MLSQNDLLGDITALRAAANYDYLPPRHVAEDSAAEGEPLCVGASLQVVIGIGNPHKCCWRLGVAAQVTARTN